MFETMEVTIDPSDEGVIRDTMRRNGFASPDDVVRAALRLLEAQQAGFAALRASSVDALAEGGGFTDAEIAADLDVFIADLPIPAPR